MDRINGIGGRGMLRSAAGGIGQEWRIKWERMSPGYTTSWAELPLAGAEQR